MHIASALALFVACAWADVNMNNPRGSNNRWMRNRANDANNRQTENNNRLFDSQTNANSGYDWGAGVMKYYEGSMLMLEWTQQHGCGRDMPAKTECDIILQYTCGVNVRDGASTTTVPADVQQSLSPAYGMHESYQDYQMCAARYRNMGLFTADQTLNGNRATFTRQDPNGNNRHGFECPEERDYYPYWQWSAWVDIAILTTNTARCSYYQAESQNVKPRGYCSDPTDLQNMAPWMYIERATCKAAGFDWIVNNLNEAGTSVNALRSTAWGTKAPACVEAPTTRDNNLGNARMKGAMCCVVGDCKTFPATWGTTTVTDRASCEAITGGTYVGTQSGIDEPAWNWTLPMVSEIATIFADPRFGGALAADACVVRVRYNVSSTDYDGWATDSASNGAMYSAVVNDPWADYGWNYLLRMAIDTTQFARTFQDRSHIFGIIPRPTTVTSWTRTPQSISQPNPGSPYTWTSSTVTPDWSVNQIWNLNVVGRRGNHQQYYPNDGYAFHPRILKIKAGDFIHPQWTGTHSAPVDSEGEGATSTDAHGMVQIKSLLDNFPMAPQEQSMFEPNIAWNLQFSGIYQSNGAENTAKLTTGSLRSYVCATRYDLEMQYGNTNYDAIRHDPYNCAKLSGLDEPHFDGGLIRMNNPGTYYFMDPRNNKPGWQTVKGTIVVE